MAAALYFHPDGFDTTRESLLGRHSAGESFLRGYIRHASAEQFHMLKGVNRPVDELGALVQRIEPTTKTIVWHQSRRRLNEVGVLNMPAPGLDDESWSRQPLGERSYAICGITHTTATERIMRGLADMLIAPTHDYDALICTSEAVRQSVEVQLDGVREHLTRQFGPRRLRSEPMRVTIPLGVNVTDFETSPENRRLWRERLAIPDDAIVALYVGRFDARAKMNPALMALALERAAALTDRPLYWVMSGWAPTAEATANFIQNTRALCPSVEFRDVDGRQADTRFSIWSVADLFISFSDNIQETFGLTPVEAMAAGLPCVVTDWDGYRDTVRDGEDGFRIATYAPTPGAGRDLAYAFQTHQIGYDNYVGAAGQYTAVDLDAAAEAIATLADNPDLRRRMGEAAKDRARAVFDWSAIIPQYEALWTEQDARRRAAPPIAPTPENLFRPDPFRLFASYPTHAVNGAWVVSLDPSTDDQRLREVLGSPLAGYSHFNMVSGEEVRALLGWLKDHGPATGAEVAAIFPPGRRTFVERALLWLARFGVLRLHPPS